MTQNCILDIENKIKIPQNNNRNFIIEKSKEGNYSLDIIFRSNEEIDLINLYLIIKSYIKNIEFFCFKISCVIIKNKNEFVTENKMINEIYNQTFGEFESGILYRITSDKKYMKEEEEIYSFRISFQKKIIENLNKKYKTDVLKFIKPLYPGSNNIIYENKTLLDEKEMLKKKIIELEKKLKEKETHPIR